MMRQYFVTGISTEVGKTIASALLVEQLKADYWKPVQSGDLHFTDSDKIRKYTRNERSKIHPETYRLNTPASPHYAAEIDGVEIRLDEFKLPKTDHHLIVEGAGGLLVPLNEKDTMLDLMVELALPVILVANYYLGSINHTLSSIDILKRSGLETTALIFMGETNVASRDIIIKQSEDYIGRFIDVPVLNVEGVLDFDLEF